MQMTVNTINVAIKNVVLAALLIVFFTACTRTLYLKDGKPLEGKWAAVFLTDECKSECQKLIRSSFIVEFEKESLGKHIPEGDYAILHKINGKAGKGKKFDPRGEYNSDSSWNGGFKITMSAGDVEVNLLPAPRYLAPLEEKQLRFNAIEGHRYYIGSMSWSYIKSGEYSFFHPTQHVQIKYWHPIVVDLTNMDVVHPKSRPKWRKYCYLAQELTRNVTCPIEEPR